MTKTFRDLGVHASLCDALETDGIIHPFPIQELTLPLALDGHDLIGQARTGTGKTLAFGLPLLQRLDPSRSVTQALVIVPTRELCLQVYEDLKIGTTLGVTSISVYGGVGYDEQIDALTTGVHLVVGTPGRLLDHLNRGNLDLSNVTQLVLDEADEMLDMGFLPDVERLVEACQGDQRHTMLFSATMPTPIVKLARRYMNHPTFTRADHEVKTTADNVTQFFFQVHRMDKPRLLARILQDEDRGGVYVFVRTKHMADRLVNELDELNTPSIAIHGDLRQSQREKNLDRFRSGKATVLVATEVAARGLDVGGVTHVVNYDCPDDEKMYLHRIGRTARAGGSGKAITFAEFNEVDRLSVIRKKVEATDSELVAVFSTSPILEELFSLPTMRPWDHQVAEGREREDQRRNQRSQGSRREQGQGSGTRPRSASTAAAAASTASPDAPDRHAADSPRSERSEDAGRGRERRRGSTDGRPKGGRDREGRGRDRDADRDRRHRDAPAGATPAGATKDGGTPEASGTERSTPDPAPATRTRTRTRTRANTNATRAAGDAGDSAPPQPASAPSADDAPTEHGQTADAAPTEHGQTAGRTRARARGRDRDRGGSKGSEQRREAAPRNAKGRGSQGGRGTATSTLDRSSRGKGRDRDAATERPSPDPVAGVTSTTRGEQARGDGQPQRARRVRVEHLP